MGHCLETPLLLSGNGYQIPAVFTQPHGSVPSPGMVLLHGTGSHKEEVGGMFSLLAQSLAQVGIASLRIDFAGCGESTAPQQALTFFGEVDDGSRALAFLQEHPEIDSSRLGVLGFSQGARVAAMIAAEHPELGAMVSWSGACQNGIGLFEPYFQQHFKQAEEKGYARIPMGWREDMLLSLSWFCQIRDTAPLDALGRYHGPLLAVAGLSDPLVPPSHATEIVTAAGGADCTALLIKGADHIFQALDPQTSRAATVINATVHWLVSRL